VGGVFTYAVALGRALTESGVEVVLAIMGGPMNRDQREELANLPGLTVYESGFALEWMDEPWSDVDAAGEWLLALEQRFAPDVVHLNGYCHGALPWRAPTVIVAHSSVSSWWHAVYGECAPTRYAEYRARVSAGLANASEVIAPTRSMLAASRRHDGLLAPGRVIPNGLWPDRHRNGEKAPFFLAAGRLWDPAKNLASIARAAPALPWPVRVAGPGHEPVSNVELLGHLPQRELASLMANAAVFVHPARYEPFGLAPLEAALSGCALVLGDIESLHEIWGDSALYVAPDDESSLVRTLCRLAADAELVRDLGRRARERAGAFTARRMGALYLGVYRELVSRRGRALVLMDETGARPPLRDPGVRTAP
jgi:glycosyltransferase involved in cell wall biosynthesis